MVARSRSRAGLLVSGTTAVYIDGIGSASTRSYSSDTQFMNDHVGNIGPFLRYNDNPCESDRYVRRGGLMNGSFNSFGLERILIDCPHASMSSSVTHLEVSGEPNVYTSGVEGASRANPSQASIQLPVSAVELKDVPKMVLSKFIRPDKVDIVVKTIRRSQFSNLEGLSKKQFKTVIQRRMRRKKKSSVFDVLPEFEFGWMPFASDIKKLFQFPALFESRMRTMSALQKGPLHRKRLVYEGSARDKQNNVYFWSENGIVIGEVLKTTKVSHMVTSTWTISDPFAKMSNREMSQAVAKYVLGLDSTQMMVNLWEGIPWSWLIDWFSNFGEIASLYTGGFTKLPKVNVTRMVKTEAVFTPTESSPWINTSVGHVTRTYWARYISVPLLPSISVPLLSERQTLILGSLIGQRSGIGREISSPFLPL